ncbi:unnamed protein product [Trifolium pratense]|uniref:Uncharacterized protein n=2 Tax=Trifolium pratense TaxID=57577 RepID=A0ACB0KZE9_TRIPR|nr:unnamed protein product [Trifolium pratense]
MQFDLLKILLLMEMDTRWSQPDIWHVWLICCYAWSLSSVVFFGLHLSAIKAADYKQQLLVKIKQLPQAKHGNIDMDPTDLNERNPSIGNTTHGSNANDGAHVDEYIYK